MLQDAGGTLRKAIREQERVAAFIGDQQAIVAREFRHQETLDVARAELAEVTDRLLVRYAPTDLIVRIDRLFGAEAPAEGELWRHLRTAAVQNVALVNRWTDIAEGRPSHEWAEVSEGLMGLDIHARRLIRDTQREQQLVGV